MSKKSLHQQLMDQAYARWNQPDVKWTQAQFMAQLSPIEYFAVATGNLNYQVENGGFSQWHCNKYGTKDVVSYLIKATAEMGTRAAVEVNKLLKRFQQLDQDEEGGSALDALDEFDQTYYKLNTQFMKECELWLKLLDAREDVKKALEASQ